MIVHQCDICEKITSKADLREVAVGEAYRWYEVCLCCRKEIVAYIQQLKVDRKNDGRT